MTHKQVYWVPHELKARDVEWCLLVNSCLKGKNWRDFCFELWVGTKNGFITVTPRVEICGVSKSDCYADGQTEYSQLQSYEMHLVGPSRFSMLAVKTVWSHHRPSNAINTFEPSIERQIHWMILHHDNVMVEVVKTCLETAKWVTLLHPLYSPDFFSFNITCFDVWYTVINISSLMKKIKIA